MSNKDDLKSVPPREIVVSSNALQLAKGWVRSMTDGVDSDSEDENPATETLESRPPRLGLGAKYLPHSRSASALGPLDKRLRAIKTAGQQAKERELGFPPFGNTSADSQLHSENNTEEEEEEEVKGSSRNPLSRHPKRISPADVLEKSRGPKSRGVKRKHYKGQAFESSSTSRLLI